MRRPKHNKPPERAKKLSLLGDAVYQLAVVNWCTDHKLDFVTKGYAFGLLVSEAFQVYIVEKLQLNATAKSFRGVSQKYEELIGLKAETVGLQKALNLVTLHLNTILHKKTDYKSLFTVNVEKYDKFAEFWHYESVKQGKVRATNTKYNLSGVGSNTSLARSTALIEYFLGSRERNITELANLKPTTEDLEKSSMHKNKLLILSLQKLAVIQWLFEEEVDWSIMHMARKPLDSRDFRGWFVNNLNSKKSYGTPFDSEYAYGEFILEIHCSKGLEAALSVLKKHFNLLKKNRNFLHFFLRYEFFLAQEGWEFEEISPDVFEAKLGGLCALGKTPNNAKMNALFDYYLG